MEELGGRLRCLLSLPLCPPTREGDDRVQMVKQNASSSGLQEAAAPSSGGGMAGGDGAHPPARAKLLGLSGGRWVNAL